MYRKICTLLQIHVSASTTKVTAENCVCFFNCVQLLDANLIFSFLNQNMDHMREHNVKIEFFSVIIICVTFFVFYGKTHLETSNLRYTYKLTVSVIHTPEN